MRLNQLRTGVREAPPPQDAQETVVEAPLSVSELTDALRGSAPLDLYDVEQAFSSLMDNFNDTVCFTVASDCAVRALGGDDDVPVYISKSVREAMTAPAPAYTARPEFYGEFGHVLPAVERCCRALEAGVVDRAQFADDVEELAVLFYMSQIRSMMAVCSYVEAALPTIWAHGVVPVLGADFKLDGIPVRKYNELGAALLKAVKELG
jgi:hypothetical protein